MGAKPSIGSGALLAVAAAAALCFALASGAAIAGDNVALFSFEPDEVEADPGEEITVEIVMASHGGYGGEGVSEISFVLDYDPEILSVTDLETESWLEGEGAEVVVEEERDEDAGEFRLTQSREPAGEGATGTAPIATAALRVNEDTEATNATLTITGSSVTLANDDPQSTMVRDAVVVVDGGGPGGGAADANESGGSDDGDPEGITLADAEPTDGENGSGSAEGEEADDGLSTTMLAAVGVATFVAVVGLAAIALRRRDPGV